MAGGSARTALLAVAATLVALAATGLILVYSGAYNVAATEDHTQVGRWLLNTVQNRSVAVRASDVPDPPPVDSAALENGFVHFRAMCVVCHGAPGVDRGEFGQGLTPTPPRLSRAARRFDSKELFWIVRNGIKMAGMPAFGPTHGEQDIWAIVAFLERLPEMSDEEYARLEARFDSAAAADTTGASSGEGGHSHGPGTPEHGH